MLRWLILFVLGLYHFCFILYCNHAKIFLDFTRESTSKHIYSLNWTIWSSFVKEKYGSYKKVKKKHKALVLI